MGGLASSNGSTCPSLGSEIHIMHTYFFAKKWSYVWIFSDAKVATKILVICSLVSCPVFDCFMQNVLQHAKIGPGDFVILFTLSKKLDTGNT